MIIKILYVEDDPLFRNLLRNMVKYIVDFEIEFAVNGTEGVEKALKNDYDVIIMDIMMPDLTGWEATKQIKDVKKDIPVIALTALSLKETGGEELFEEHIRKPVKRDELKEKIKKVVAKYY